MKTPLKYFIAATISWFIVDYSTVFHPFPIMIIMIPVACCIYILVTLVPKWIVEGRLGEKKRVIIPVTMVWILVVILSWITRLREGPGA